MKKSIMIVLIFINSLLFGNPRTTVLNFAFENESIILKSKIENKNLLLIFDTGWNRNITLAYSGIEKVFGSIDNFGQGYLYEYAKLKGWLDEDGLINLEVSTDFSMDYLVNEVRIGNLKKKRSSINIMPALLESREIDGFIGLEFFEDYETLTIDFINKKIYVNKK